MLTLTTPASFVRTVLPTLLICSALTRPVYGQESESSLKELRYNNPGLEVDLGVGLWAWPMPIDYDRDGDMDLLVACPDKPSNGIYFFENPTQDPSVRMPVFRPGVRIGRASQNMQLSYVGDQPRLLSTNLQRRFDPQTGALSAEAPERIYPKSNVHPNRVRANMWRYADFDSDGDHDLLIGAGDWTDYGWDHAYDSQGRWRNGPLHGYVYLLTNSGTDAAPEFTSEPQKLTAGGGDIDVYGWPSPCFSDFDGDGDSDLICGEFLDGFTWFRNIGSGEKPVFAAGQRLRDSSGRPLTMNLQMITPTQVDWDGDGDMDLIVGDEDGRVALVEHTGTVRDDAPVFLAPQYFRQEADTLKYGALATPWAYDWDGDGDEDLLCGNTAGTIGFFENLGQAENGQPRWAAPVDLKINDETGAGQVFRVLAGPSGSIQGPCEAKWGYTTLSVADWDGDGDGDIIYNSILSRIGMLRRDGDSLTVTSVPRQTEERPPVWYWWQTESGDAVTSWRTTPVAADFDGDEVLDLVMLDQSGYLTLRRGGGAAKRHFIDESGQLLRLNSRSCGSSGRVKLAVVDWDGDGRTDVLTNSENATWYRNRGTSDGRTVLVRMGNLSDRNVAGHTSSPAVCDFDRDGKPDLLVGAENGRIYFASHDDCIAYPSDVAETEVSPQPAEKKFPGFVSEEFIYTKAPFPECHASTICETSRGLVAAWFGGTKEGKPDVGIWYSYFDGERWASPALAADGVQHDGLRYPCWNPVLYQPPGDAPTLLFFKVGPNPREWWGEFMVSYDRGRTFRDRRRLPEGIDGPVRCKPILLSDGRTLLCGSSTEYDGWRVHFERTVLENGVPAGTWQRIGPINTAEQFNAIQPTILQHPGGDLQVLCRTKEGKIVSSRSTDDGQTWSPLTATELPNPNSGIEAVTLRDGRHLLVYNHLGSGASGWGRRGLLNLAVSDDGKTWFSAGILEQEARAEFSYPAVIQTSDGMVHVTYTWKRQRVRHVVIDPDELQVSGPAASFEIPSGAD